MAHQIGAFLTEVFPKKHLWKIKLFQNWGEIIGSLSDKVRIERLEKGTLILGVCHPVWAQELFLLSDMLKSKINKVLQEDIVKNIHFRTVVLDKKSKTKKKISFEKDLINEKNIENIAFSSNERASLNRVKSADLRFFLKNYYVRCKKGCVHEKGRIKKIKK